VPLYVAWAVLLDAAIHGWDDLSCSRELDGGS
jgi:hypothetical protein